MNIVANTVRPFGLFDTLITFEGVIEGTEDRVVFAADHRPARDIRAAIAEEGEALCVDVPEYMIIGEVEA